MAFRSIEYFQLQMALKISLGYKRITSEMRIYRLEVSPNSARIFVLSKEMGEFERISVKMKEKQQNLNNIKIIQYPRHNLLIIINSQ